MPDDELIQLITLAVFRYIALEWVYVAIEQFFYRIHADTSFKHNRIAQKKKKSRVFSGYL